MNLHPLTFVSNFFLGPLSYEKSIGNGELLDIKKSKYQINLSYILFLKGQLQILYGISSFGYGCAADSPNIYTRINKFLDWIEAGMDELKT